MLRMLEFFAGSGLAGYGLRKDFRTVWANDICPRKKAVYDANRDGSVFVLGDIRAVSGLELPSAELAWASFPCQDLSLAGMQAGLKKGTRSSLVWEFLRVIDEMPEKPCVIVMENVAGFVTAGGGRHFAAVHEELRARGWQSGAVIVDAALFVPQSRPRVFVIAVPRGVSIPAGLSGSGPCWLHSPRLATLGAKLEDWIWWTATEPPARTLELADVLERRRYDCDHVLPLIPPKQREKLRRPGRVVATGYRRTRNGRQVMEIRTDGLAGCLRTAAGGSSRQYVVVKGQSGTHARLLTPGEYAALMGAPGWILEGSDNDGRCAMGDAVVVPVIEFLARAFLAPLARSMDVHEAGREGQGHADNVCGAGLTR